MSRFIASSFGGIGDEVRGEERSESPLRPACRAMPGPTSFEGRPKAACDGHRLQTSELFQRWRMYEGYGFARSQHRRGDEYTNGHRVCQEKNR